MKAGLRVARVYSKMFEPDLISIVVTTYNRSDALVQVIRGLTKQDDPHFEVIVADDGSTQMHRHKIAHCLQSCGLRASHVWHPDVGFTAARVRNLGVAAACGSYIVFLDGDCIPEYDFVRQHRRLREAQHFVNGSRVLLSEAFTQHVLVMDAAPVGQNFGYWLQRKWEGASNKYLPLLRWPGNWGRRHKAFQWSGIRSCNMAVWRTDFEAICGFDESFVGWGHEDADFVLRLHNYGCIRKNGFFATEVYHLWHAEASRGTESANAQRVRERIQTRQTQSTSGYQSGATLGQEVIIHRWGH